MDAIFRGVIESAKIDRDTSQTATLELIVSAFMITINGKIQVINRNPIRFFTDKDALVNKPNYNVGDTVKITVKQTDEQSDVEEILCYAEDKPKNKLSSSVATGTVISFREVIKSSHPYEAKRKKTLVKRGLL